MKVNYKTLGDGELWSLQSILKLNKKDFRLLIEAFRRKHFLEANPKFLGCGAPSYYKSSLFRPSFDKEIRGVANWYTLTEEGERKMKELEQLIRIPKDSKKRNTFNEYLFDF